MTATAEESGRYEGLIRTFFRAIEEKRVGDVPGCFCDDASFQTPFADEPMPIPPWVENFLSGLVARFDSIGEYAPGS